MLMYFMKNISNVRRHHEKEGLASRCWGRIHAMSKRIASQSYKPHRPHAIEARIDLNKHIVGYYNACLTIEKVTELRDLVCDAVRFLTDRDRAHQALLKEQSIYFQAAQTLVERAILILNPCATCLNEAVGQGELYSVVSGPEVIQDTVHVDEPAGITDTLFECRARVSTRTWSLFFLGRGNTVDVHMMPPDKILRLRQSRLQYPPIFSLVAQMKDDEVVWTVDGQRVTDGTLQDLCMMLFSEMIERTKKQIYGEPEPTHSL